MMPRNITAVLVVALSLSSCRTTGKTVETAASATIAEEYHTREAAWRGDELTTTTISADIELDSVEITVRAEGRPATVKARRARIQASGNGTGRLRSEWSVRDSTVQKSEARAEGELRSERRTGTPGLKVWGILLAAIGIFCVTLRRKT